MPSQPSHVSGGNPSTWSFARAVATSGFSMMSDDVDQPGIVCVARSGDRSVTLELIGTDAVHRRHASAVRRGADLGQGSIRRRPAAPEQVVTQTQQHGIAGRERARLKHRVAVPFLRCAARRSGRARSGGASRPPRVEAPG